MRQKLGLVLGAGSAKGLAHIGVLAVLEKNGIRPDYVSGTSIGAAIGALYCAGISPEQMRQLATSTEWQALLDFTLPKTGVLAGNKVEEYMQTLTNNKKFSELLIPLRVVATDIKNATKVVFSEGNVAKAVRASISIPGVFSPVILDSHELVDGALLDPMPIEIVKNMGANFVIAVDIGSDFKEIVIHGSRVRERSTFKDLVKENFLKTEIQFFKEFLIETKRFRLPQFIKKYIVKIIDKVLNPRRLYKIVTGRRMPKIGQITVRSMQIMAHQLNKEILQNNHVDVIISPIVDNESFADFDDAKRIIWNGELSAQKAIPKIKRLLHS